MPDRFLLHVKGVQPRRPHPRQGQRIMTVAAGGVDEKAPGGQARSQKLVGQAHGAGVRRAAAQPDVPGGGKAELFEQGRRGLALGGRGGVQAGSAEAPGGVQRLLEQIAAVAPAPPVLVDEQFLQPGAAGVEQQATNAHRRLFFIKDKGEAIALPLFVDVHVRLLSRSCGKRGFVVAYPQTHSARYSYYSAKYGDFTILSLRL